MVLPLSPLFLMMAQIESAATSGVICPTSTLSATPNRPGAGTQHYGLGLMSDRVKLAREIAVRSKPRFIESQKREASS
jgi:hypothetical protein